MEKEKEKVGLNYNKLSTRQRRLKWLLKTRQDSSKERYMVTVFRLSVFR